MTRDAVVLTGAGSLGAAGPGLDAWAKAFGDGRPPTGAVGEVSTTDWIPPMKARRMSPPTRYAVAAARMALDSAGLPVGDEPDPSLGVVLATAFGPGSYTQRLIDQLLDEGAAAASPALFTECVANAPAGQVAIQCSSAGPNYTLCNREVGGMLAAIRAAQDLDAGRADRMLAGMVDELPPLLIAILERYGALARPDAAGEIAARPFARRRDGFLAGEGATIGVFETSAAAAGRGARPWARVLGWGRAFDPSAGPAGWGRGDDVLAAALGRAFGRAGVDPGAVDLVVSGASGSVAGDRLEAAILHRVFGDRIPTVVAPKSIAGEYGGGQLAAVALALRGDSIGTAGFDDEAPDCRIRPARSAGLATGGILLATALAAGGGAAWLLLERM